LVGLQPSVVALASRAKNCSESDELLQRYRAYFARSIGRVGHHPMLFTKVGWVENMTFREKLRNLLATKFSQLEFLQCHNICLYDDTDKELDVIAPRQKRAQWRHRRVGPAFLKFGRRVKYLGADLNDWVAQARVATTESHAETNPR
jgi:hypothetical protein